MEHTYIVWREGVYMQGIFGIYTTLEDAIENATEFINNEPDDYHNFNITRAEIGKNLTTLDKYGTNDIACKIVRRDKTAGRGKILESNIKVQIYEF